jgi:peptidoglycan/LPS O-acetylase OafA/YrhL
LAGPLSKAVSLTTLRKKLVSQTGGDQDKVFPDHTLRSGTLAAPPDQIQICVTQRDEFVDHDPVANSALSFPHGGTLPGPKSCLAKPVSGLETRAGEGRTVTLQAAGGLLAEAPFQDQVHAHRKTPSVSTRLTALDGLRGLAALVVVLHHLYLVAVPFLKATDGTSPGSPYWWISNTPLKALSAGSEAVLVFFVLSGLVVALPALGKKGFSWAGFLSGRFVRLYLPVWASLAFGAILIWVSPRDHSAVTHGSWVNNTNATSTTIDTLLQQASLTIHSYNVNNALWSLRWEITFSVLLPLFVALAVVVRHHWLIAIGTAFILCIVGDFTNVDALRYLPVFFIGTLMAVRLEAIKEWAMRCLLRGRQRPWRQRMSGITLVSGSLLLITANWLAEPMTESGTVVRIVLGGLAVLGAAGLVLSTIVVPFVRGALESQGFQWLGRVSFSLYLVHVPIIATLAFLLGDGNWLLVAALTVPIALLIAWGFHWLIERPSHRLARRSTNAVAHRIEHLRTSAV